MPITVYSLCVSSVSSISCISFSLDFDDTSLLLFFCGNKDVSLFQNRRICVCYLVCVVVLSVCFKSENIETMGNEHGNDQINH